VITLGLAEAFGSRGPLLVDSAAGRGASVGGRGGGGGVGSTLGGGGLNSEAGDGGSGSAVVVAVAELLVVAAPDACVIITVCTREADELVGSRGTAAATSDVDLDARGIELCASAGAGKMESNDFVAHELL
jgi:hypothetical protein